jgi:hypothetical protein
MNVLHKVDILTASWCLRRDFPQEGLNLPVKYNHSQSTSSVCTSLTLGTSEYPRRCIEGDRANLPWGRYQDVSSTWVILASSYEENWIQKFVLHRPFIGLSTSQLMYVPNFDIFKAVTVQIVVFWVVTPCSLVGEYNRLGGIHSQCIACKGKVKLSLQ